MPKPSTGRWIGVAVLAFGAGVTALRWYAVLSTKGLLDDESLTRLCLFGPLFAATGVAMLVLPRGWFGPEGKLRSPGWRPLLATVGLGLLLVAGDVPLLEHFERQWEAAPAAELRRSAAEASR
jgi:hypothetical protein